MARAVKWTVSKRTKTERKQQRQNVRLWDAGITKRTQARYFNALSKLLPVLTGIFTALDLDDKVSNWIETMGKRFIWYLMLCVDFITMRVGPKV